MPWGLVRGRVIGEKMMMVKWDGCWRTELNICLTGIYSRLVQRVQQRDILSDATDASAHARAPKETHFRFLFPCSAREQPSP